MSFLQKNFFVLFFLSVSLFAKTVFSQQTSLVGEAPAVTVSEYTDFLNCVAATDTYGLYNPKMGEEERVDFLASSPIDSARGLIGPIITRSGNPGSYTYSCNADKASFPVTYVSWISAVRYCNWKTHHGAIGLQDSTTTETGSYDLTAFDQGADISTVVLSPGANFFLPSNYLVDTTSQDAAMQGCDPYLVSSRLGFCIATWISDTSSTDATGKNAGSVNLSGESLGDSNNSAASFSGLSSPFTSSACDTTFNNTSAIGGGTLSNVTSNSNSHQINMSLVLVGAPNNPADLAASGINKAASNTVGYGSVLMPYQIGMYDVTAEQYCAFLNAVARKSDPYLLYNTNMTSDPDVACIIRSGDTNGGYTYTPMSGREKFPITYVGWYSAMRFCNWLENGQPTAEHVTATTTEHGSYDVVGISSGSIKPGANLSYPSEAGAAWLLPTEDQWYKAAYYIPSTNNNKTLGTYCTFGTGNLDAPGNKWEEAAVANRANYSLNGIPAKQDQPHLTECGHFKASRSPWGAYDMAGEVNQWTSTSDATANNIIIRGGAWKSQSSDELKSTARLVDPGMASPTIGFRLVYNIPPPPVITHLDMTNDLVAVLNPNNPQDAPKMEGESGFGSVPTVYQIGKYDVTAEQYCMFLNAVAAHADPHHLYNPQMTLDSNVACIIRYGNTNKGYSYFPWPGREKFPITYVNWFSALRFCNWLENNQPIGDESEATTESGSFNSDGKGVFSKATNNPKWLLPTENQWYKAAYYNPPQNQTDGFYYSFGTSSYAIPANSLSLTNTSTNAVNYCYNNNFTMPEAPYLTAVGTFSKATSPCGAYDMAGNVSQWTMTPLAADSTKLVVRGGSWQSKDYQDLRFSKAFFVDANESSNVIGFRLVYNVAPPLSPTTTWEQFSHRVALCGAVMKGDANGLLTGEIFRKPGTYFFDVMYYSVGAGLAEIVARACNFSIYTLNWIFTQIANWIKYAFGDSAFQWFDGWMKTIYDFLLSPIKGQKLASLGVAKIEAQLDASKAVMNAANIEQLIYPPNAMQNSLIETTDLARLTQATAAVTEANAAFDAAVAAEAAQAGLVAFFASPAGAIIVPALLSFGFYEAFIATTNNSSDPGNDPRIAIGLGVDTLVRYLWPAIQLCL